jgi:hypothetical protein
MEDEIYCTIPIATKSGVYPNQIRQWRAHLIAMLAEVLCNRPPQQEKDRDELKSELYRQIGRLKV